MWTSSITSAFGIVHFLRFLTIVSPLACVNTWVWRTQKCSLKPKQKATSAYLSGKINCLTWEFESGHVCFERKCPVAFQELPWTLRNAQERSWPLSLLSAWCLISWQDRSSAALQKLWAVIAELGVNYSVCVTFFWWRLTKWVALCDSEYLTSRSITAD